MLKRIVSLTFAIALLCITALGGYAADAGAAKKAVLKTKKMTIEVGAKKKIVISKKAKKARYTYKSSKKAIATVSSKGIVKGKKSGKAKITVKEKLAGKTRKVGTVSVKVSSVKVVSNNTDTTTTTTTTTNTGTDKTTTTKDGNKDSTDKNTNTDNKGNETSDNTNPIVSETPEPEGVNLEKGWKPFNNSDLPELESIVDASVSDSRKFTHQEWTGADYTDNHGRQLKAPEVTGLNVKDASATSTSYVSYDNIEAAISGARDYKKELSKYVQFLTGSDDSVKDWSLAVVRNQNIAQNGDYADFYKTNYQQKGSEWKNDLELPASWTHYGFDFPIYTNVDMPWQGENVQSPRCATNYNPVGMYRKTFKVDQGLVDSKGRINISFQGVESCYYLYINGKEVGYSEDSFSPHSFDITDYLNKNDDGSIDTDAENLLALEVHKFCDGTWYEDQDFLYDGGIFRDVYLYATPLIHLEDYFVITDLDNNYKNANIILKDITVSNYSTTSVSSGEYAINVALYDEDGVAFMNGWSIDIPALPAGSNGKASVTSVQEASHNVIEPELWSCEQPNLYEMVLSVYNKETGTLIDTISQNLGFRELDFTRTEVDGNGKRATDANAYKPVTLNGQPFYLKGTCRHDTDPLYGKYCPRLMYAEDIKLMKQSNINAIRTSHYSNDEYLYYLCEKYGMYLMAETNLEGHALQNSAEYLKTPFKKLAMDRTVTAFERLKNRTAIIMWSTGNENHYNDNKNYCDQMFYNLIWYFKDHDRTRMVHSESSHAQNGVDVDSEMYPWDIRGIIYKGNVKMPYLMCEYCLSQGNSTGSVKEYWESVRNAKNHNFLGGFLWVWADQSRFRSLDNILPNKLVTGSRYDYYAQDYAHENLYKKENDGQFFSYGGDNGDITGETNFCVCGIVSPDRDPQPELKEVKYQYQNFWFDRTKDSDLENETVKVYNESSFDNLNDFDVTFEVYEDDKLLGKGTVEDIDIEPRQTGEISVPFKQFLPDEIEEGREYYLNISANAPEEIYEDIDGEKTVLVPKGYPLSYEQFRIPGTALRVTRTIANNSVTVNDVGSSYEVKGDLFSFKVNKNTGAIENYIYKDELVLQRGPVPNFWRAPTNNDRNFERAWQGAGDTVRVNSINVGQNDKKQKTIDVAMSFSKVGNAYENVKYTIDGSGSVRLDVTYNLTRASVGNTRMLRVGNYFILPTGFENVNWLGRGGYETYNDRCSGAKLGAFESTVDELFYPFVEPQDTGNLTGVKWFTVTDPDKKAALAITTEGQFEASALHFTADDLTRGKHVYDLSRRNETYVSINSITSGAGNSSFGPEALEEYRIYSDKTNVNYSFTLVPYTVTNAWGDIAGYVSGITRQYRAQANNFEYADVTDDDIPDPRPQETSENDQGSSATEKPKTNTDTPADTKNNPTETKNNTEQKGSDVSTGDQQGNQGIVPIVNTTVPGAVKSFKVKKKSGKAVLSWKKDSTISGYEIRRSVKKKTGFKKLVIIKQNDIVKYTDKKAKKNKTYYYKIRTYVNDGGKICGKWSKVKKIKL